MYHTTGTPLTPLHQKNNIMRKKEVEVSINTHQLRRLEKAIRKEVLQPRFKRKVGSSTKQ